MHVEEQLERTEGASSEVRDPRQEHPVYQDLETQDRQASALAAAADELADDLESGVRDARHDEPRTDLAGSQQTRDQRGRREDQTEQEEGTHTRTERDEIARHRPRPGRHVGHRSGERQLVGAHRRERQLGIPPVDPILHEYEADHEDDQQDGERKRPREPRAG